MATFTRYSRNLWPIYGYNVISEKLRGQVNILPTMASTSVMKLDIVKSNLRIMKSTAGVISYTFFISSRGNAQV